MRSSVLASASPAPAIAPPECRYCGCGETTPCHLRADFSPVSRERLHTVKARDLTPCSWHRMVELVGDDGQTTVDYFAVCTNRDCVRAYLADPRAP